jgi:D-beta-D-heptose 7-phosphate kinase/D-beta-D-heptose 1-phosphate adenosyltransferase
MIRLKKTAPRILVVGDLMIDSYLWGKTERISPEAPVPVVEIERTNSVLGGAGNVIANLISLGAQAQVASVIGEDESGRELESMLQAAGVEQMNLVRQSDRKTAKKSRLMATHQQVVRFDWESKEPISKSSEEALGEAIEEALKDVDLCLLSDYGKGVLTPTLTRRIVKSARTLDKPVLIDPKGRDYTKYAGATLITPNRKEAGEAVGYKLEDMTQVEQAGKALREENRLDHAVITLSEAGMAIFSESGMTLVSAKAKEVFDVTGAGDTVLAALGVGLAGGLELAEAAHFANTAAAVVVGKLGSATASLEEVIAYDQSLHFMSEASKIKSLSELSTIVSSLKEAGKKVVFTNGCFDLLHRGHVEYLKASRRQGDLLIVGLNSDASVRRLKGESRPVVCEEDRALLLAALEFVDFVVIFDEETPLTLIRTLRPTLLTKGADYAGKEVVGSEYADRVELIDLVEGRSTTNTLSKIQSNKDNS